jgi:glycosyltransferase involved in cell wall biosynthesis
MLAILTTHPIQYQVPLWQALAKDGSVPFEVWYLSDHGTRNSHDVEFGESFAWDLNMLQGYSYRFLNVNPNPKVSRFLGVKLREPLENLFREKQVTALWIQGWQVLAYWQAVWQAHAAGIPVWVRGESNDLAQTPFWKKVIKRAVVGQLFSRIQQFLYIGQANRRLYESYGIRPEQLHPAPYCVDNERFAREAQDLRPQRAAIRRAWNIPEDAFCILFAGKFIPKKRPWDLTAAARDPRLQRLGRPLHLLFVGSGELGGKLRDQCRVVFDKGHKTEPMGQSLNGHGNLPIASFAGFLNQTEMSKAYVAADCLVLPSDPGETWGLVVNEAMASGLPCIVSDACGCAEDLIRPVSEEFCFRMAERSLIAKAITAVMNQSSLSSCLERQVARFNFSVSVATIGKLYRSARPGMRNEPEAYSND